MLVLIREKRVAMPLDPRVHGDDKKEMGRRMPYSFLRLSLVCSRAPLLISALLFVSFPRPSAHSRTPSLLTPAPSSSHSRTPSLLISAHPLLSFPRRREPRGVRGAGSLCLRYWLPVFTGMTKKRTGMTKKGRG
jgi:hypothetical protein